jgi:hypothetical protein
MTKFKNNNHYTIFGWMIHRLGLKDAKLIVYAIVYSFSQDGENEFYGGRKYMAEASARSLPTIDRMLAELEKDGLIKKMERENDGVSHCRYSVFIDEDSGEGIVDPEKTKNSNDNTPYHDDNTPPYHDDNTNNKDNINNNKDKYKENKDKSLSKKVQEGFVFEDDREANFIKWCNENIPNLMTKVKPLTYKQYISLNSEFTRDEILNKLLYMNSMKNFKRRFSDVHGVLLNWLRGDKDPNYTQRFRNKKNKVA